MRLITIRNRWLLRFFWGKREVYPKEITAGIGLWWHWFKVSNFWTVVPIQKERHHDSKRVREQKSRHKKPNYLQRGFE